MISIYNCKHLTWLGQTSVAHYEFFADDVSDLPTTPESIEALIGPNHKIAQGSITWVISSATPYMYDSEGNWVAQGS